jgi:hypothetical protein
MTTVNLPAPEPSRAQHLITRFGIGHVLVVGDVMLDRFHGRVSRSRPKRRCLWWCPITTSIAWRRR